MALSDKELREALKCLHFHNWIGSAWNPWMVEHEQRCDCGAYRHRFLETDQRVPQQWLPGEHPKARFMRGNAGVAVPVRTWQHDETGRITQTAECPGPRWAEVPTEADCATRCKCESEDKCVRRAAGVAVPLDGQQLDADIARLMAMTEPEIDAELRSMGIDPAEAERQGKVAVEGALEAIRARNAGVAVPQNDLDPRTALDYAKRMKTYCESFNGRDWGMVMLHGSTDEQNLAHALDNLTECAAMLMNMAERVAAAGVAVPQNETFPRHPPMEGNKK